MWVDTCELASNTDSWDNMKFELNENPGNAPDEDPPKDLRHCIWM